MQSDMKMVASVVLGMGTSMVSASENMVTIEISNDNIDFSKNTMFRENSNDINDSTLVSLNNIVNEFLEMEKKSKSEELNSNSKIYCS